MELSFLGGPSEMAARIRGFDWSRTVMGPPADWPATLKAMLRLALTTRHPMFIFWGPEHLCFYNDAYSASLGPEKHPGILGERGERAWPEIWDVVGPQIARVMRGEGATWHENQLVPIVRHGALQDVYWTYSYGPIDDPSAPAGVGGVMVVCTETTRHVAAAGQVAALRKSEADLREREEQLRLATDAADVGLWDVDLVSDTLFWPPRVKAMFGISPDVAVSMADFYAGLHPADRARTVAAFESALDPARRAVYDVEYRTVGKEDQRVRWVAAKGRGIFDEHGRCVRVIGTAIDVTARKSDDARLRELNERLEQRVAEALADRKILADIVEGTDAFVQVSDLHFNFLAVNRSSADEFERIFGIRPKVGDNMLRLLDDWPDHRAAVAAVWGRALAGEEFTAVGEFGDTARDRRHYEMKFNTLRDPDGQRIGAYQFVYDVTERVRSQDRLARAEEALRQAQKMEAVGQLTGGIAHDFNNVLQAVKGALQLIRSAPAHGKVSAWADTALRSVHRGAELTSQLLTFARERQLAPRPLVVAQLVAEMEDMLQRSLGPLVQLRIESSAPDATVHADATQLEMAILNLAINARDAMPDGGVLTIASHARRVDQHALLPSGDYVELVVGDTGSGMPDDVVARAFDPFFTTKGVGKGTGLGLSQVYGMASQAGGTASIWSRVGHGTSVTLLLPRSEPPAPAATVASAAEAPDGKPAPARILVVDDDAEVRSVLVSSLESLGHQVTEAEDGAAGLHALESVEPALLVVDFAMPGMNGAEVAKRARARRPGLPILFVSGYADTEAIEATAGSPPAILRKPFELESLERAVGALLAGDDAR